MVIQVQIYSISPEITQPNQPSSYKIIFDIDQISDSIKPEMTAHINVVSQEKSSILTLPKRSIIRQGNQAYVIVLDRQNQTEKKEIQTGLVGSNGLMEIVSRLNEDDQVIKF